MPPRICLLSQSRLRGLYDTRIGQFPKLGIKDKENFQHVAPFWKWMQGQEGLGDFPKKHYLLHDLLFFPDTYLPVLPT